MLWTQFIRLHRAGFLCTCFVLSQLSTVCSDKFELAWFECKLSLRIETGTKSPLNMLKEGAVVPGSTVRAYKASEASSMDRGLNKRGWLPSYPGPFQSDWERTVCNRVWGRDKKTKTEANILCIYNIRNRSCCFNSIHLQAFVSRLHSVLCTQRASM